MAEIKQNRILGAFRGGMLAPIVVECLQAGIAAEEWQALLGWKKRSDSVILIRLKAEAILYASHGVDLDFIAEMVGRTVRTVRDWLSAWRASRPHSVITGHAGDENAAKLTREQKEQLTFV